MSIEGFTYVASIGNTDIVAGRLYLDALANACGSMGMTLVESRLQASRWEWSIVYKPTSLGTSSIDYYLAFGVSSQNTWQGLANSANGIRVAIFRDWNTSSKMTANYPRSFTGGSITGSGTTTASATWIIGSAWDIRNITFVADPPLWSVKSGGVKWTYSNETFLFQCRMGGEGTEIANGKTQFDFLVAPIDSILAANNDIAPVALAKLYEHYTTSGSTTVRVTFSTDLIFLQETTLLATDSFVGALSTQGSTRYSEWSFMPNFNIFTNEVGVSRVPVYGSDNQSLRGFIKDLYWCSSAAYTNVVKWNYSGNSFSADSIGGTDVRTKNFLNKSMLMTT